MRLFNNQTAGSDQFTWALGGFSGQDAPDPITAGTDGAVWGGVVWGGAVWAGSAVASASVAVASVSTAKGAVATPAISMAAGSVLVGQNRSIAFSSLFTVASSGANPAYLIVSGLDRNEYTAGYKTSFMGHLADASTTQGFANFSSDGWSVGVVFTYQASTGQYVNSSFGSLSQLMFDTGSNRGDTATISVFGTNNAGYANAYAGNPVVLAANPSLFTNYGSVVVETGTSAGTPPASATPDGIVSAALSYVGSAWNNNGCWILASDISAQAGATLPVTSTLVGLAGVSNGEWIVAYNGPTSGNSNWVNNLTAGEMVAFVTTSGGGHITTVVSGHGTSANLVDNITYVNGSGAILNSANDGSASDIIVQAPHSAMQEFSGVNPSNVVVYELDAPVVATTGAPVSLSAGTSVSLAGDFSASNPVAAQSVTGYQVYETNSADTLTVSGVAKVANSAAGALTLTSLSGLGLTAGQTQSSDTVYVRAFNGSYWGDWTALTATVKPPAMTVSAALGSVGTGQITVSDTAANIGAAVDKLQALVASGRLTGVTIAGGGWVPVSAGQISTDTGVLALLPGAGALQASGATMAQAASMQSNAQVAIFAVNDTAAHVSGNIGLAGDSKLTSLTVSGTSGGDNLNLTGSKSTATINLGGDTATAIGGLGAAKLVLAGAADVVTLGTGAATISAGVSGSSGIMTVANFQFGLDALQLGLGNTPAVTAIDTSYGGVHAVALSGGNLSQGVVLLNQPGNLTAASVMSGHIHTSNGMATIS